MITNSLIAQPATRPLRAPDAGVLPRGEHDRILSALARPPLLVGDGSLLDDVWRLRPDGPHIRGKPEIDYRVPVAPGPVLLTDPVNLDDLLTAKLYLYYSLSNGLEGWTNSARVLRASWNALLYVIRWRVAQGLPRMADLTRPWFDLFVEQVRHGGRWHLLPYEERVRQYLAEIREGREVLPIVGDSGRRVLAVNQVARRLGVSGRLQIPDQAWGAVLNHLEMVDPVAYRHTVRLRTTEVSPQPDQSRGNRLTVSQVTVILQPFDRLWILRNRLAHDPIPFRAFDHQTTCQGLAEAIASKDLQRTNLPPSAQVCWLVDASLRLVLTCEPYLQRMQEVVLDAFRRYPRDEKAGYTARTAATKNRDAYFRRHLPPLLHVMTTSMDRSLTQNPPFLPVYTWRPMKRGAFKEGVDIRDLLFKLLPAACAVIIATLTARRNGEITGLHNDCLIYDEYGDPFLSVWIQKTLRHLDKIPVPMSVVRAVEVLRWLSADSRAERNEPWLFSFKDPGSEGGNVDFQMSKALKALAAFARVPPLPDGSEWDFKPHQFRGFFGVTYFWRFDYPSLTALSDFYKHFNPTMTQAYVTRLVQGSLLRLLDEKRAVRKSRGACTRVREDETTRAIVLARERARDFKECREAFILEVARGAVTGATPLSGWGGEAWNRELEALIEKVGPDIHLVPTSGGVTTLDAMLSEWVKGKHLDTHPAGHGFCKCGSDRSDLGAAACLTVKREREGKLFDTAAVAGPDYAYAADETCLVCPHNIQRRDANERYWLERLTEAEHTAKKAATNAQRIKAECRAARISEHIRRCFGKKTCRP